MEVSFRGAVLARLDKHADLVERDREGVVTCCPLATHATCMTVSPQLTQDLKLLDILEALPRPEEPDTQALRARLAALCSSQSVDATPKRIGAAVQRYMGDHDAQPQISTTLWERPESEAAREGDSDSLKSSRKRLTHWAVGWGVLTITIWLAMLVATCCLLPEDPHDSTSMTARFFLLGLLCFPIISGGGYRLFKWGILERLPWLRRARTHAVRWTGQSEMNEFSNCALHDAPVDIALLARWLASPAAANSLRQVAQSSVSLTQRDAKALTELAMADEVRMAVEKRAQQEVIDGHTWKQSMALLAGSAAPGERS